MSVLFPEELAALEEEMFAGLAAIEDRLREEIRSDYELADITARHLVEAGGKRFRPLLVLLASHFGDPKSEGVVPSAVVVELTHLATLYHDDVMDEAEVRRGTQSANSRWGNTVAILSGDFLFARSSKLLADLGPDAVRVQAETFERLVIGQLRESVGPQGDEDPIVHHLEVLADKTGSLIAAAGRYGAMMSGVSAELTDRIADFGESIGIAFQLSDDLLDIEHAEALAALRVHPAMDQAREVLEQWADRARERLTALPDCDAKTAMATLVDSVAYRTV